MTRRPSTTRSIASVVITLAMALMLAEVATAEPWLLVGPRQQAMGGAGVATTFDSLATYWNPAALGFEDARWDVQFPVSGQASFEGDIFGLYDELHDTADELGGAFDRIAAMAPAPGDLEAWRDFAVNGLPGLESQDEGFAIGGHTGLLGRYRRFAFSVQGHMSGGADFFFDGIDPLLPNRPSIEDLVDALAAGVDFSLTGDAGALVLGLATIEPGVAYGHLFEDLPIIGDVALGANVKLMFGTTFRERFDLLDAGPIDIVEGFVNLDGTDSELSWGIDLGLMVRPCEWLTFGVVGRNLNSPRFNLKVDGGFELEPQARFGLAITPIERLTLALDVDLTRNASQVIEGLRSRQLGVGAEYILPIRKFWVAFRAGGYTDLQSDVNNDWAITAGLALGYGGFSLELGGGASLEDVGVGADFENVPTRLNASLLIRYEFGGPAHRWQEKRTSGSE
jgi:hypothetical protein